LLFFAIMLALVVGGLIARHYFSDYQVLLRQLEAAPRTAIGKLTAGATCVTGTVSEGERTLLAPLSGRRCVAFHLLVEERRGEHWRDLTTIAEAVAFWIADETGKALVEPGTAFELALVREAGGRTGLLGDLSEELEATLRRFLAERGLDTTGFWGFEKGLRFREGVLVDGETASVAGYASREIDDRGEVEGPRQPPSLMVLRPGSRGSPLKITDDPDAHRALSPPE
jgi:hypothetical protein